MSGRKAPNPGPPTLTNPDPSTLEVVEMGDQVQDIITGVKGIATGTASYITGCDQVLVNPRAKKDGTFMDGHWFDITRLKVVKRSAIKLTQVEKAKQKVGGPQHSPGRR